MWISVWVFALCRYRPVWKQRAAAHGTHKPHLRAASQLDGKLARKESLKRRHWENNEGMQTEWADPEAAQPVENKKWWPRHAEGPNACTKALEDLPLSQNCHSEPEENHQVPSQLYYVQTVSEAVFRNDRKSGSVSKNKLLITGNGHWAVSSRRTRCSAWVNCFSVTCVGVTMISFSSPRTRFGHSAQKETMVWRKNITPESSINCK